MTEETRARRRTRSVRWMIFVCVASCSPALRDQPAPIAHIPAAPSRQVAPPSRAPQVDDEEERRLAQAEAIERAEALALSARPVARALARAYVEARLRPEDRGRPLLVVAEWLEPTDGAQARPLVEEGRASIKGPAQFGAVTAIVPGRMYDHVRVELEDGMDGEAEFAITVDAGTSQIVLVDRFTSN